MSIRSVWPDQLVKSLIPHCLICQWFHFMPFMPQIVKFLKNSQYCKHQTVKAKCLLYTMHYDNHKFIIITDEFHEAKRNKPVRGRQIRNDFTHMWNLMNKLNWKGKWGQTHRWRAGWQLVEGGDVRGWRDWAKRKKDSWTWTTVWWLLR